MCFHTQQTKPAKKLQQRFKAEIKDPEMFSPSDHYNGFAHPHTPVIIDREEDVIQHCQWGLIPFWSKDESIKKYTLNARMETLTEKPSFRTSVGNRCLVIVDGFFEWQWQDPEGKEKVKYNLKFPDNELFTLGGLWSDWQNDQGDTIRSYSIVTTEANELMARIHNHKKRMPVVLDQEMERHWLMGGEFGDFEMGKIEIHAIGD